MVLLDLLKLPWQMFLMKGLELASKFPLRNHIFMEMKHGTHRIAVLDLVSKQIFFVILLKRLL
jgi:hypothetical protein